jgi:hypothetical protein
MRTRSRWRRGAALAAVMAVAGAAAVAGGAVAQSGPPPASIPPANVLKPGTASPATFTTTQIGKGLKQGRAIPAGASVTSQAIAGRNAQGSSFNIDQPAAGQYIVSATAVLVSRSGKTLKTYQGSFVPIGGAVTPVFIMGQTRTSDAGVLVTLPANAKAPAGSRLRLYALFRKGAKPSAP